MRLAILALTALVVAGLFVLSRSMKGRAPWFVQPPRPGGLPVCVVRELTAADLAACEAIYHLNEPDRFPPQGRGHFLEFIRQRRKALFLVAEAEGTIRGFGGITMDRRGTVELAHLVFGMVDPAHHGQGFGTALLLARLAVLPRARRCWTVALFSVAGSESFYRRFGFEYVMTTATGIGSLGELYRVGLTPKAQAQCVAGLGDRLRVKPFGEVYIASASEATAP